MQRLKSALEMPGHFGVPILSDLQFAATEGYCLLQKWQKYGSAFKMRLLGQKCAVLIGAEANRLVLVEQADCLSSYLGWRYFVEPAFGLTLMIQDGQEHSNTRRLMMPAFHSTAIASYFETMQEIVQASLKTLATQGEVPLMDALRRMTLLVGVRLLLGVPKNQEIDEIEQWYEAQLKAIVRGVVKEIEFAGYQIPPDWTIIISQFVTHRLSSIYTNPEEFDPDRFAPPREEDKKVPFSLLGFGGGAHVCIGREFALMEIKIFLASLLRKYHWVITPEYSAVAPVLVPPKAQNKLRVRLTSA